MKVKYALTFLLNCYKTMCIIKTAPDEDASHWKTLNYLRRGVNVRLQSFLCTNWGF